MSAICDRCSYSRVIVGNAARPRRLGASRQHAYPRIELPDRRRRRRRR
jgi:hypothetical protein